MANETAPRPTKGGLPSNNSGIVPMQWLYISSSILISIRSAKAALRMAQLELDDNRELMALELSQAYNTLKEQMEALEIARLSVEQATENLRLSRSAYDSGVETLSDHLEAQALWQSALADEIDARAQLLVALSKWRKAAGR